MGRVGRDLRQPRTTPFVPAPYQLGISQKGLRGGQALGIEAGPEPGLGITEGGNTTLGGDTGSGEHHYPAGLCKAGCRPVQIGHELPLFRTRKKRADNKCRPLKIGGATRDRTADLLHAMQALSQLSYSPNGLSTPTPKCR